MEALDRIGGRACLDFLNTVDERHGAGPGDRDHLDGYEALLEITAGLDVRIPAPVEALRATATADPRAAGAVTARAVAFRDALYAVLAAVITDGPVPADALAAVNDVLCEATAHHVLAPAPGGGIRDGWTGVEALSSPLWPVAVDAWDVLTTDVVGRVKECPGEDGRCGWLFLDTSRSGTRRWCDMRTCGNRAKARSHYARAR